MPLPTSPSCATPQAAEPPPSNSGRQALAIIAQHFGTGGGGGAARDRMHTLCPAQVVYLKACCSTQVGTADAPIVLAGMSSSEAVPPSMLCWQEMEFARGLQLRTWKREACLVLSCRVVS